MAILPSSQKLLGGPLNVYGHIQLKKERKKKKKLIASYSVLCKLVLKTFLQETNEHDLL